MRERIERLYERARRADWREKISLERSIRALPWRQRRELERSQRAPVVRRIHQEKN